MRNTCGFTFLPLLLFGCDLSSAGSLAEFGATPGGVKDLGLARELVENGRVPPPEAFVVEGIFSEHDLPLEGPACAETLCIKAALGVAPDLAGRHRGWMQLGLSSNIDAETFERPPLTIIATVDVSGSMGWDYSTKETDYGTPGALSRQLLKSIAARLTAADRIAIVTYGSNVSTHLRMTRGDRQEAISDAIDDLEEDGSTNMEAGLERAYALAKESLPWSGGVRVLLFTDAQPNVGATTASDFEKMVQRGSESDIGLTVFGLGLGLGQDLFDAMSKLRGGNAFSLFSAKDVGSLMDESWPWMACPIAYDLHVGLETDGVDIVRGYGFPGSGELHSSTIFLSRRRGALLVELGFNGGVPRPFSVDADLAYEDLEGGKLEQTLETSRTSTVVDGRGQSFEQPSTAKTVALAILVTGMEDAARLYSDGEKVEASELMDDVVARIELDREALDDTALDREVELARKLRTLIKTSAPQGNLYDVAHGR